MDLAKNIVLWVSGLIASIFIGGAIGAKLSYDGAFLGWIGGAATFTCLRLWLTELRQ